MGDVWFAWQSWISETDSINQQRSIRAWFTGTDKTSRLKTKRNNDGDELWVPSRVTTRFYAGQRTVLPFHFPRPLSQHCTNVLWGDFNTTEGRCRFVCLVLFLTLEFFSTGWTRSNLWCNKQLRRMTYDFQQSSFDTLSLFINCRAQSYWDVRKEVEFTDFDV